MEQTTKNLLLSVQEMYEADRKTIENGISGIQLMEAAGAAIAREIRTRWTPRKTVILCGPGNNGGDGFVVARLLSKRGWNVRILLLGKRDNLKGDAKINADRWPYKTYELSPAHLKDAELIVDAVFGAGLARDVDGIIAKTLRRAQTLNVPIVAVDIPTGIHGDTGQILGQSISADLTVTFARAKTGHYLYPAEEMCGELIVADIGIPDSVLSNINPKVQQNRPESLFPFPANDAHKYTRGHAVIIGGQQMTGATRLAATCARRVGAGLLTISAQDRAADIYRLADPGNIVSEDCLDHILKDPRKNSVLIGPGLGLSEQNKKQIKFLLESGKNLVLDADALTLLSGWEWKTRNAQTLLTPHEGEFSRLFPQITGSKLERAIRAAKYSKCAVLLKGPDTVIASPDGRAVINDTGTPWLATAGSGDSLAGICLGLMTQGLSAYDAGQLGAWLHGKCAETFSEGLIAEDIGAILPQILQSFKK